MRKRFINGEWIKIETESFKKNTTEDLSITSYIKKYGGIESQVDGKVYTTKKGYMDHLKNSGCFIKDKRSINNC